MQKLEIPTVYFLLFLRLQKCWNIWTLKKKKKSWMTSSLASQFSFFFFICLAITTDDIARHWESSSKAWETAVANQIMRYGVIHLRVTLTLLPLWHAHARPKSVSLSLTHAHTHTHALKLKNRRSLVSWEGQSIRDRGWQEHKVDGNNDISFWIASARWTTTVIYS